MCVYGEPKNFNFRLTYSLTFDSLSTTMFINSTIFAITERIACNMIVCKQVNVENKNRWSSDWKKFEIEK